MPTNIVMDSAGSISLVAGAFFASGGLNAGTPFDTASTPVIAVHPFENAVNSRKSVSVSPEGGMEAAASMGAIVPLRARHAPTPMTVSRPTTKEYVGRGK